MRRPRFACIWFVVSSLGFAWPAGAQSVTPTTESPSEKSPTQLAKEHFDRALVAYGKGKYGEAIQELEAAVKLDPGGTDLRYNLAMVHEKLGNVEDALAHYREVRSREKDPAEQQRLDAILMRLEGARTEVRQPEPPPCPAPAKAPSPAPPPPKPVSSHDDWIVGSAVVAGAALVLGAATGIAALATDPDGATTEPGVSRSDLDEQAQRAHTFAVLADLSFVVALASGAVAASLYTLRPEPNQSGTAPTALRLRFQF